MGEQRRERERDRQRRGAKSRGGERAGAATRGGRERGEAERERAGGAERERRERGGRGQRRRKDQPHRVEEARRPSSQPRHPAAPDPPRVSSPRPRLSSDPEEKGKLSTREQQQKTMHKGAWLPPTPSQSTPGQKQSPKPNLMPVPNT